MTSTVPRTDMNRAAALASLWRILILLLATLATTSVSHAAIPDTERTVLRSLYISTNGDLWTRKTNWNGAPGTECTWFGVVCNLDQSHVITVILNANSLSGVLPATLNRLTALQVFIVADNQLTGSLPSLNGLTVLRLFDVSNNRLNGSIPILVGLSVLKDFDVARNQLCGSLPSLAGLSALQSFRADANQLSGAIPTLTGLSALISFSAYENQLSGSIPSLAGLSALNVFQVPNNKLTGIIPALTGLTSLAYFNLAQNELTGLIPPLTGLLTLQYFDVSLNQLTGSTPSLAALAALQGFVVHNNQLRGIVPAVPIPSSALGRENSKLCPNQLTASENPDWDTATLGAKWYEGCIAALPQQVLGFGGAPTLTTGGTGIVVATLANALGSDRPIVYSSLTPGICSVDSASGLVTVAATATIGSTCTITADKANDAFFNSAVQIQQSIGIQATIPASERAVLLALYTMTNGDGWDQKGGWNSEPGTECLWFGIECNADRSHVTTISLSFNRLIGTLPATLNQLTALRVFVADNNQLRGAIPLLSGLSALEIFDVSTNVLGGKIPSLQGLSKLLLFNASENQLTGSIPSLADAPALRLILLEQNRLSGVIPEFSNTRDLQFFDASANGLTGAIPSLAELVSLTGFDVSENALNGAIPPLAGLTGLSSFDVSRNQLEGSIPALTGLSSLRFFAAFSNKLNGSIPSLTGLNSLQSFYVFNNQLDGSIPQLRGLQALQNFEVGLNRLTGVIPQIAGLSELKVFDISDNQLRGSIPSFNGLTSLRIFRAENNRLDGLFPSSSIGLPTLQQFTVQNNQLTGNLPQLGLLFSLQTFDASHNKLTGSIPAWFPLDENDLGALRTFNVSGNQLTGSIPSLAALSSLRVFNVANNQLSGALPSVSVPSPLVAGGSKLCPNQLTKVTNTEWDVATRTTPWHTLCTAPLSPQVLTFGIGLTPPLLLGGTVQVNIVVTPSPGSTTPVAFATLTPTICSVDVATGLVTALPAARVGFFCDITVNKGGDTQFNSAEQIRRLIPLAAPNCRLDVNGDGFHDPGHDGLLIQRYLTGFRGTALMDGLATGAGSRFTPQAIETYLSAQDYDVRGTSPPNPQAMRDGLAIMRYLQNQSAQAMIAGTDIPVTDADVVRNRIAAWCAP
jgi:Leucine-rich repeat (LRR) protein